MTRPRITVNVSSALDPEQVAAEVAQRLRESSVRVTGVTVRPPRGRWRTRSYWTEQVREYRWLLVLLYVNVILNSLRIVAGWLA